MSTISIELLIIAIIIILIFIFTTGKLERPEVVKSSYALGSKEDGTLWKVGIQNPFKPRGEFIGILNVKNKSVVTSGNYERFFCRYLCPLGAVFSIISKLGITKINKHKADCGKCRTCTMNCSMGLNLYKVDGVRGGDCINCLKCTEVCPRNNANANVLGQDVNQNLAVSVAMATMLGVYGLTNFAADALTNSGVTSNQTEISSSKVIDNGS